MQSAKRWGIGCVGAIVALFAILFIWGELFPPAPEYVPAAGHLLIGKTLYFRDHTKHGVIVNAKGKITLPNGKTDPESILVDQGNNVILWENAEYAGQIFLVGYNVPGEN